jgi:hypothetical protein
MKAVLLTVRVEVDDNADPQQVANFVSACIVSGSERAVDTEHGFEALESDVDLSSVES